MPDVRKPLEKMTLLRRPLDASVLSEMLIGITRAIHARNPDYVSYGGLGGEFGYGAVWDGQVFEMNPFYWVDCTCGAENRDDDYSEHNALCKLVRPNFLHRRTGFQVSWYKWIGRSMKTVNQPSDYGKIEDECLNEISGMPIIDKVAAP